MSKTTVLDPQLHSNVPGVNFCQWKIPTEAVLAITENSKSKGQGHLTGKKAKMDPKLHCKGPDGNLCQSKKLI